MDLVDKYLEKGLTPLELIKNASQKIACVDNEGYKYYLSYRGAVGDKRTKHFDKWSRNNPYKPYNMRLYASRVQNNVKILSNDYELREANDIKITFCCPSCGKEYQKRWCHWIAQPDNQHFCQSCSEKIRAKSRVRNFNEVKQEYEKRGLLLLSNYEDYLNGGGNLARLFCMNNDGYKFATSINSLANGNNGTNKFSGTNPFATENFQKWCDENDTGLTILEQIKDKERLCYALKCSCGNVYYAEANEVMSLGRQRCPICSKRESRFELKTRCWLSENHIPFVQEYRFRDCRYKRALPFDFKCDWNNSIILIEVDGGQHYYVTQWTDENCLKEQKIRDNIKTQYCENHGYILLRIPYWLFETESYKKKLQKTFFGAN